MKTLFVLALIALFAFVIYKVLPIKYDKGKNNNTGGNSGGGGGGIDRGKEDVIE